MQGLLRVGEIKAGETLVVSGAAGATGSIVCQIGKKKGARVIAIAGGADKCRWLKETVGVDAALDYKSASFYKDFKKLGYLDVFFDNVGGQMLDFMLTRLNKDARIVLCGSCKPVVTCMRRADEFGPQVASLHTVSTRTSMAEIQS
jgi:NADPH-dependent curcumin reductase CurA